VWLVLVSTAGDGLRDAVPDGGKSFPYTGICFFDAIYNAAFHKRVAEEVPKARDQRAACGRKRGFVGARGLHALLPGWAAADR
jgi:hypothetical protein